MTNSEYKKLRKYVEDCKNEASYLFDKCLARIDAQALKTAEFEETKVIDYSKPPF